MLVDSSVWVAFLRGAESGGARVLAEALQAGGGVWLAPPILQEVLQGADRPERYAKWDRVLGELPMLEAPDQRAMARAAARRYARCHWQGLTPRSANDCLIASYALAHRMPLLHADSDFALIARAEPRLQLLAIDP